MPTNKVPAQFKEAAQNWLDNKDDADASKTATAALKPLIEEGAKAGCDVCKELQTLDHYLVKRSQWIIGGDGASYDIGYGVSTMYSLLVKMSIFSYSILRYILTLVVRVQKLLHLVPLHNLLLKVSAYARKTSVLCKPLTAMYM